MFSNGNLEKVYINNENLYFNLKLRNNYSEKLVVQYLLVMLV